LSTVANRHLVSNNRFRTEYRGQVEIKVCLITEHFHFEFYWNLLLG